jgi:7-keto-8-aminopelargonate synthetase-like enzyme
MGTQSYTYVPQAALEGSMRDYRVPAGKDLLERVNGFFNWQNLRRQHGLWPFSRSTEDSPGAVCAARDDRGDRIHGVNFASQDYLSLSSHPAIKAVAKEAIDRCGVHSAGSPALVGNTANSVALERKIAEFLHMNEVALFPTGWAAGYGVIKGLVRSSDHIVMDNLSHTCLQEGAMAATRNISMFRHLQVDECREKLRAIRAQDTQNGIMVVTEGLFSMDSDTPDLVALQDLCHEYGATLMVDVAHDLGCLGEDGRGHIGLQNMLGKIDLVMGSFSKTFGSNGGFVACGSRAIKEYLRFYSPPCTFSNALSPVQAAIVMKAFEIIDSAEGRSLRTALMNNILSLRRQLTAADLTVYGDPSAIVCVKMGNEGLARLVGRRLPELGLIANLVEFPAVPKGQARFRMQVMARHTEQNIADAVIRLRTAFDAASAEMETTETPMLKIVA